MATLQGRVRNQNGDLIDGAIVTVYLLNPCGERAGVSQKTPIAGVEGGYLVTHDDGHIPDDSDVRIVVEMDGYETAESSELYGLSGTVTHDVFLRPEPRAPSDFAGASAACPPEDVLVSRLRLLGNRMGTSVADARRQVLAHRVQAPPGKTAFSDSAPLRIALEAGMRPWEIVHDPDRFAAIRAAAIEDHSLTVPVWKTTDEDALTARRVDGLSAQGSLLERLFLGDPLQLPHLTKTAEMWVASALPLLEFLKAQAQMGTPDIPADPTALLRRHRWFQVVSSPAGVDAAENENDSIAHPAQAYDGGITFDFAFVAGKAGLSTSELHDALESTFPREVFWTRAKADTTKPLASTDLQSQLDPLGYPDFTALDPQTAIDPHAPHPEALITEAATLKRLYLTCPDAGRTDGVTTLLELGIRGAAEIVRLSRKAFEDKATTASSAISTELAGKIYAIARDRHAASQVYASTDLGDPPVVGGDDGSFDLATYGNLSRLVGTLDGCGCEHCRSVLSPGAYLVDLLRWLDTHGKLSKQGSDPDLLLDRRPDIATLTLSCANTNTEIPYIDRVIEVLGAQIGATETAIEAELNTARDWPFTLPFSPKRSNLQVWLDATSLPLARLQRLLVDPNGVGWEGQSFGWGAGRSSAWTDPTHSESRWGYASPTAGWEPDLAQVAVFLQRAHLDWEGLRQLLATHAGSKLQLDSQGCSLETLNLQPVTPNTLVQGFDAISDVLRLAACSPYTIWESDLVLHVLFSGANPRNASGLTTLAEFELLRRQVGLSVEALAAWFGDVDTRVDPTSAMGSYLERRQTELGLSGAATPAEVRDAHRDRTMSETLGVSGGGLSQLLTLSAVDPYASPANALDFLRNAKLVVTDLGEVLLPAQADDPTLKILTPTQRSAIGLPDWTTHYELAEVARLQALIELDGHTSQAVNVFSEVAIAMGATPAAPAQVFTAAGWPAFFDADNWKNSPNTRDPRAWLSAVVAWNEWGEPLLGAIGSGIESALSTQLQTWASEHHTASELATLLELPQNANRARARDAMVTWLLDHDATLANEADLLAALLIDAPTAPCMMTSRVKEAISATQLFIHQGILGLYDPIEYSPSEVEQWRWMKNYRVWEAARKIFLWPENWILPELRREKTELFRTYESTLLDGELTDDLIEQAFLEYADGLREVARLDVHAVTADRDLHGREVVHVFGRTRSQPHQYFHRTWTDRSVWTAWERVDLEIQSQQLLPVVQHGRLRLFWTRFDQRSSDPSGAPKYWHIYLLTAELGPNGWTAPRESADPISLEGWLSSFAPQEDFFLQAYQGDSLTVQLGQRVDPQAEAREALAIERNKLGVLAKEMVEATGDVAHAVAAQSENLAALRVQEQLARQFFNEQQGHVQDAEEAEANAPTVPVHLRLGHFYLDGCTDRLLTKRFSQRTPLVMEAPDRYRTVTQRFRSDFATAGYLASVVNRIRTVEGPYLETEDQADPVNRAVDLGGSITPVEIVWSQQGGPFVSQRPFVIQDETRCFIIDPVDVYSEADLPTHHSIVDLADPTFVDNGEVIVSDSLDQDGFELTSGSTFFETRPLRVEIPAAILEPAPLLLDKSAPPPDVASAAPDSEFHLLGYAPPPDSGRRYRFVNLYHPFACEAVREVRKHGAFGILDPETVDGNADFTYQIHENASFFQNTYTPTHRVDAQHPEELFDFAATGSYAVYNWELFFHIPFLTAMRLSAEGEYERATQWFHSVFDPRVKEATLPAPAKYFKVKGLADVTPTAIADRLEALTRGTLAPTERGVIEAEIARWSEDPFDPHGVAWMRPTAYQKAIILRYLEHLLTWADSLFRRDTIESIQESLPLYLSVSRLLGRRPVTIEHDGQEGDGPTWTGIANDLDGFANASLEWEMAVPQNISTGPHQGQPAPQDLANSVFCIPRNERWDLLWDWVEDRLFKLRNCMNIDGRVRTLDLFEPPIDPALLAAGGLDALDAGPSEPAPVYLYRYSQLVSRARELVNHAQRYADALQSALEKEDAEEIAALRAEWQEQIHGTNVQTRKVQADEARRQLAGILASRESATKRLEHYTDLINDGLLTTESTQVKKGKTAAKLEITAQQINALASVLSVIPQVGTSNHFGGQHLGAAATAIGSVVGAVGMRLRSEAGIDSLYAGWARRRQDWSLQRDLAEAELKGLEAQIAAAELRIEIADREHRLAQLQRAQAQQELAFLASKFSNQQLYTTMRNALDTLTQESYELAHGMVRRAEKAFEHETNQTPPGAPAAQVSFTGVKRGLLAASSLHHRLDHLESEYLQVNTRCHEITKRISLARLNPNELVRLRTDGICSIWLPEELYDLDFPGQTMRRIKSVTLTIPATVGPLTGVTGTLKLVNNWIRKVDGTTLYSHPIHATIALSTGQEDSGLFQLDFSDPRYLPFEYAGAISQWDLELSEHAQYDWRSIAEVVMTIRYSSMDDTNGMTSEAFKGPDGTTGRRKTAMEEAANWLRAQGTAITPDPSPVTDATPDAPPGAILLSLRHDLPDVWFSMIEEGTTSLEVPLDPWVPRGMLEGAVSTQDLALAAFFDGPAPAFSVTASLDTTIDPMTVQVATGPDANPSVGRAQSPFAQGLLGDPETPMTLVLSEVPAGIRDLFIVVTLRQVSGIAPTIAAGSEPWPGGTVTSNDGDEWYVDGMLDSTGPTFDPGIGAIGALLTRHDSTTQLSSPPLEIEQVEGLTKTHDNANLIEMISPPNVPAQFTIIVEYQGVSFSQAIGPFCMWARRVPAPDRKGVLVGLADSGALRLNAYTGGNGPTVFLGPVIAGGLASTDRHIAVFAVDGGDISITDIVPHGAVQTVPGTLANPTLTTSSTSIWLADGRLGSGGTPNNPIQGKMAILALNTALDANAVDALALAGSIRAWGKTPSTQRGGYDRGDVEWYATTRSTVEAGVPVTAANIEGATWDLVGGSVAWTHGGLNEPT